MDLNHAAAILNPRGFKTVVSASETPSKVVVKRLNARLGVPWGIKKTIFVPTWRAVIKTHILTCL